MSTEELVERHRKLPPGHLHVDRPRPTRTELLGAAIVDFDPLPFDVDDFAGLEAMVTVVAV